MKQAPGYLVERKTKFLSIRQQAIRNTGREEEEERVGFMRKARCERPSAGIRCNLDTEAKLRHASKSEPLHSVSHSAFEAIAPAAATRTSERDV